MSPLQACATARLARLPARHADGGVHCKGCHRDWVSLSQAHCTVCHEQFATDGVARRHWTKPGHVHPNEVSRLVAHEERYGTVWRLDILGGSSPPYRTRATIIEATGPQPSSPSLHRVAASAINRSTALQNGA
jgi:hypothetical protein